MKRLLIILAVLVAAVSCLENGSFETSYSPVVTFDCNDSAFNPDSLCFDTENKIGLHWGYLYFYHKIGTDSGFKGGFLVSRLLVPESGETESLVNNQYRVYTTTYNPLANKYAVFLESDDMPQNHLKFMFDPSGGVKGTCIMKSMAVNNTLAVAKALRTTQDARLVLNVTGCLAGQTTRNLSVVLADMAKDSLMSHWTTVSLEELGIVDEVKFALDSSSEIDVPKSFCMDNLYVSITLASE